MLNHSLVFWKSKLSWLISSRTCFQLESDLLVLEWGRWAAASCCRPKVGLWKRRLLRRSNFCFMAARLLHSWTNLSTCRGERGHNTSLHIQFQDESEGAGAFIFNTNWWFGYWRLFKSKTFFSFSILKIHLSWKQTIQTSKAEIHTKTHKETVFKIAE